MPDEPKLTTLAQPSPPPPPTAADYEAIHAAVMATVRGRWFLAEYARRNRNADTDLILAAIDRVAAQAPEQPAVSPAERMRFDLVEMAKAIAQTRAEIASIKPDGDKGSLSEATEELDSIVHTTERATSDILAAAEQVQEIAWTLRERGADPEVCDAVDRRATDIYTACSFQDLTGQRIRKVVEVLRFLEERIRAMIEIWGGAGPASSEVATPPHLGAAAGQLDQPDIDRIMPAPAEAALATAAVVASVAVTVPIATDAVVAFAAGDEPATDVVPDWELAASDLEGAAAAADSAGAGVAVSSPDAAILDALALALAIDPGKPAPASEPQPALAVVHEAAPVEAPEPEREAALPPEPITIEAAPTPDLQPEPEMTRGPEPAAAPEPALEREATLPPEPIAIEVAPTPEPRPEPEVMREPEPTAAVEPTPAKAAPAPEPVAIEAPPEPQPEPEVAQAPEPAAALEQTPEPEPETAAAAGAARPDPTEMLRRILALIRPSGATTATDGLPSASPEDGRFVATLAVSEIDETGARPAGAETAGPSVPASAASVTKNAALTGPLTVDQAVSELLLKALARAAAAPAAPPRPVADRPAPAAEAETPSRAEVAAEPVAEGSATAEPAAATPLVDQSVAEPAAEQAETPIAHDAAGVPAALAAEPAAPASAPAEPVAEEPAATEAPAAAAALPAERAMAAPAAAPAPAPAEPVAPPATAVVLPLPPPASPARSDGLAAFRALSDEDKIALFS